MINPTMINPTMISLMRAEFGRLRSRRIMIIGPLLLLIALAGFQVIVEFGAQQPSATDIANARHTFQQAQFDYRRDHDSDVRECQKDSPGQPASACAEPAPQWSDFQPHPAPFSDLAWPAIAVAIIFSLLVFVVIGASSIGAEYGSGALANWLSFIPDRTRVYASKLGVLMIVSAVVGAAAVALNLAGTVVLFKINADPVPPLAGYAAAGARGVIVVVVATTIGFALAIISRHTIAALGAVLGYLVVDFVQNDLIGAVPSLQYVEPWLPETNITAVITHGHQYYDQVQKVTAHGVDYDMVVRHLSFVQGLGYLLAMLVVAIIVSLLVFRRRDVT